MGAMVDLMVTGNKAWRKKRVYRLHFPAPVNYNTKICLMKVRIFRIAVCIRTNNVFEQIYKLFLQNEPHWYSLRKKYLNGNTEENYSYANVYKSNWI